MMPGLMAALLSALQQEPELPSPFTDLHVEVKADVWFASFAGGGRLNSWFGNERDTEKASPGFSFHREGRLDDATAVPGGQLHVLWENDKHLSRGFGIQFRRGSWSESGTIDQPFVVDGTTVPAGRSFRSRMLMYSGLAYALGAFQLPDAPVEVRGRAGLL